MEDRTFKIYYIKFDEIGNEIDRGVHPKEYKNRGCAYNAIRKLYPRPEYEARIGFLNPFEEHFERVVCDCCGQEYDRELNSFGADKGHKVIFYALGSRGLHFKVCPKCAVDICKFIKKEN